MLPNQEFRTVCRILALFLTVLSSPGVLGDTIESFPNGANSVFIGHSFFIPIARQFNTIISSATSNNTNAFVRHGFAEVISGGETGTPGSLWKNQEKREAVTEILSSGDIDLFAMTTEFSCCDLRYYHAWIDLALSYNPDTKIYIGVPWVMDGATMTSAEFDMRNDAAGDGMYTLVSTLRQAYRGTDIMMISYGNVMSLMMTMFEVGGLADDISRLVGPTESIFLDISPGHSGSMGTEIAAMVWISILYDTPYESLDYTTPYNEQDVVRILDIVLDRNESYNQRGCPGGRIQWLWCAVGSLFGIFF